MKGNCYGDFKQAENAHQGDFSRDSSQMGFSISDLWDKGVSAVETLASNQLTKYVSGSNPVPVSNVVAQPAQPTVIQGQNTTTTQYVSQPMTEFQKQALLYGGIAVGGLVLLGLVKTIFPSPRY